MKTEIPFADECADLSAAMLEMLNSLQTEFLRVMVDRGLGREDLVGALTSLAVSAIDSLKAALLLCHYDDFQDATVMFRRSEEFLTVMAYFTLVDDGTVLRRWQQQPHLVLREKRYKVRSLVAKKMEGFFTHNPIYDFKENFDTASKESVHATHHCAEAGFMYAMGRYSLMNPGSHTRDAIAATLHESRAVMFLGVSGPTVSRFLEFLQKCVFTVPELSAVSPGRDHLQELDMEILRSALHVQPLVERFAAQMTRPPGPEGQSACG